MCRDHCFAIMPFDIKPIPDKPSQTLNFDEIIDIVTSERTNCYKSIIFNKIWN